MTIHLKGEIGTGRVWLRYKELYPGESQRLINHSPDGFSWGYGGSGPSQLALAICLELFDRKKALKVYQVFKWRHIATLPQTDFERDITVDQYLL